MPKNKYYDGGSSKKGGASVFPAENKVKGLGNLSAANSSYGDDTMKWIDNRASQDLKYNKKTK